MIFFQKNFNKNLKIFSKIQKSINLCHKPLNFLMEPEQKPSNNNSLTFRGVPETLRYKPVAEFSLGNILRIQSIHQNPEKYFETEQLVCGWARTLRLISY